jgi:hypothetical protein
LVLWLLRKIALLLLSVTTIVSGVGWGLVP